ncbi:MAG: carbohydrate ABC transporter permease [Armatimonadota bacterium]|nr:carbohydrate ABC transporter permease [Armatimonadota bacterium]
MATRSQRLLLVLVMLPVIAIILLPYLLMLSGALKSPEEIVAREFTVIPQHPQPANFVEVFRAMPLARFFLNSTIIAVGAMLLVLACAIPAGYALGRLRFFGRRAVLFAILTTQMFSPIVLIIALFSEFTHYGLLEGWRCYIALILADGACRLAFSIWLLTGYFSTVPREVEEAALIDGCSRLQALTRVLLPICKPGVVTTMIFAFITAWNEFVFALTFVPSDEFRPLTVAIPSFIGQYGADWHLLMAAALLATVPVVAMFLLVERHLVRGLGAGAIK